MHAAASRCVEAFNHDFRASPAPSPGRMTNHHVLPDNKSFAVHQVIAIIGQFQQEANDAA